jgi:hypothetical protein
MRYLTSFTGVICVGVTVSFLGGCAAVAEKTNFMSDSDIKSKVAGTLGYVPDDITLLSRRTEGTNTYVVVSGKNKKEFACTLNGGNLLTAGIVNPPSCSPKS